MAERERVKRDERDDESIQFLEAGLSIDEHELDAALIKQPDFFYRVSKQLALAVSNRDSLKQRLADEEARTDVEIRRTAAKEKEKVTETEVKNLVRLDKDVTAMQDRFIKAARRVGELTALKEAYQQRSYVLKDLVNLYIANYYNQDGGGGGGNSPAARAMKDHSARIAKEGMREARRRGHDDD